jgi:hypothetical protein
MDTNRITDDGWPLFYEIVRFGNGPEMIKVGECRKFAVRGQDFLIMTFTQPVLSVKVNPVLTPIPGTWEQYGDDAFAYEGPKMSIRTWQELGYLSEQEMWADVKKSSFNAQPCTWADNDV